MESGTGDAALTRRPMLASSWDAACGALAQSLHLARAGPGARDFDWEELLAPPAPGCAGPAGLGVPLGDSHAPGGALRGGGGREGEGAARGPCGSRAGDRCLRAARAGGGGGSAGRRLPGAGAWGDPQRGVSARP